MPIITENSEKKDGWTRQIGNKLAGNCFPSSVLLLGWFKIIKKACVW